MLKGGTEPWNHENVSSPSTSLQIPLHKTFLCKSHWKDYKYGQDYPERETSWALDCQMEGQVSWEPSKESEAYALTWPLGF